MPPDSTGNTESQHAPNCEVLGGVQLIKIGAKIVSHGRYVAFQMAEVAMPRMLFAEILRLIAELRPPPDIAPA
jgi:hypothetical protein